MEGISSQLNVKDITLHCHSTVSLLPSTDWWFTDGQESPPSHGVLLRQCLLPQGDTGISCPGESSERPNAALKIADSLQVTVPNPLDSYTFLIFAADYRSNAEINKYKQCGTTLDAT